MKGILSLAVIAMSLAACASSQTTSSAESAEQQSAGTAPARKKVCKYEKTSGGGSRMERVCRYVDAK